MWNNSTWTVICFQGWKWQVATFFLPQILNVWFTAALSWRSDFYVVPHSSLDPISLSDLLNAPYVCCFIKRFGYACPRNSISSVPASFNCILYPEKSWWCLLCWSSVCPWKLLWLSPPLPGSGLFLLLMLWGAWIVNTICMHNFFFLSLQTSIFIIALWVFWEVSLMQGKKLQNLHAALLNR